ncbi:hypothetical protein RM697_01880 [Ichthyenterobacterium sp. W332]|uniref:Uncharacterized protein n=1 Tax=Microcosmobacter mediterraneus TaxID=3075607 RepID=A0ABU2YGS6_9FLAO|nr:hypothetical protein [Ichthyenterobacterium sp. W332]MDT0557378.1 hypothetical protein [Ichthyenterobacterium sp. W332]
MKFSLTKLKAAFGNPRAMEKLHVDDHTEAIINDFDQEPFAVSDDNVLYAGFNELGGYYFMQTIVIGRFHVKTFKGATLEINAENLHIKLNSDMMELESEYSNVSNRSISKIDFQIEKQDLKIIQTSKISEIKLTSKKQSVSFTLYKKKI